MNAFFGAGEPKSLKPYDLRAVKMASRFKPTKDTDSDDDRPSPKKIPSFQSVIIIAFGQNEHRKTENVS